MAEDIRISVGADTTQMETQIANAVRKAAVVIRPTIESRGLERISAPLGRITGQADEFTKSMEAANARVLAFGASVGVLNAVAKSFENIVTSSTLVEAALKEIQVATGDSTGSLEKLGEGIFEIARATGLSFKQASEATLEFARQGGTLEDSLKKANAALVLTRTTGLDAAEAVKGLTAAVLSFNQVGLDYETVVNKLAAVDTKFAVSSRDLIEGISRSASVAQEAGVSFDELTALITTLQEKTARGGAVIGNALKTIFQRVQTTDNLKYIRSLGIAVTDASENILPATKIIKDLADEFKNLDSATRKELLIKIGGGFQIDKLAALLNDISNANGTFERSLNQSLNAGNQGFAKVEQLNKTVQASFDRLATSGTQFAATIGKIAFSDDFRSILNKTSSFLESLNESVSGGEEGGATIGKALVKGIGSILTGPGALLLAGLGIKLFGDLAKFGVDSLKNQLGVTNVKKEQQDIEKSILGVLMQNTAVQTKILSLEGDKTAQAQYLLDLYSKQAATLEKMSRLSKDIAPSVYEGGIRLTSEGTKDVKAKNASGGFMPKEVARAMELREAPAGASIREISNFNFGPKEGRGTMIVNSMESVHRTPMGDFVIPSYSKTRTGKPTLFSAAGYVPNFAEESENKNTPKILNVDAGAYSFAGLTIGGTGTKAIRSKALTPDLLQRIKEKDPALTESLSKYNKIQFQNVSVGNVYRRRDENLDSLDASEVDIKNHFIQKANSALSPQIGSFIKDELDSLGIKPTPTMQLMMNKGVKFDFVNDSMAGTFFETMLKMANMSAEDDNFGQFFNDSNSRFDIYGLKPEMAEQYGLPKKFWEYVEIKSSEKSLNDELGDKFIQQVTEPGGEPLKSKLLNQARSISTDDAKTKVQEKVKSASRGYVPNFALESVIKKAEVSDFKNLKNAKNADPIDEFKASINVKRLDKNEKGEKQDISFFRSQADEVAKNLIGKRGNYKDPKVKEKYFEEWKSAGVDPASLSAIETLYNGIKPTSKKSYEDKFIALKSRIQGTIGEIAASKTLKKKLTTGNAYFDLPNQTEVRTRQKQSAFDILRKGVNNYLSENNIANNGPKGKPKKDRIDLNQINLVLPSDSTFNASKGYVPNFAIKELNKAPVMTIGGRVKNATIEQLKSRLGGDAEYTTDLAGTKVNENLDIGKIKNDIAASILGPNYHLIGSDGNLDTDYYLNLISSFATSASDRTVKTAFGEMPQFKTDANKVVTGEVSGFARELKYERLGQIFDIIAKNRNMQDIWTQIFQTKASAGVNSINTPDQESKISKLVTQFRPVVIDELTKRLKTKISAIMTTVGRDDAEFLALGKNVNTDQYGNLLAPDKLKVDKLQEEKRFVMPLQTPENLKRVGKSRLDRIILKDPKKRITEGENSSFNSTSLKASSLLNILSQNEYPYGSFQTTKEDKYTGRKIVKTTTGWKGEDGIEARLNKYAEESPFLVKKIKSNFIYDKNKKKMVVAGQAEIEKIKLILEAIQDFGISDWDNINFEKSLQTYDVIKSAAEGFTPNLGSTQELKGEGIGMLYEDPKNFKEVGGGQSGKFLAPLSGKGFGQKIFYKPGSEKISQEYNVNSALKQFEKQNPALFKQNAISFTNVGNLLSKNNLLAGFEREFIADSGVDEFVTTRLKKKPSEQIDFAFYLSERMAQQGIDNILKSYKDKNGADSIRLYDVYAGNFKINEVMQDYIMQKTAELFKGGDGYSEASKLNANELNKNAGSKGGLHTMYDTMGATNIGKTAAKGYVPNFASGDVDGDGSLTRNDPFIKRLIESAKKFTPIAKELTNNIVGNLLNMPEGIDLFEIIDQLKFAQKAQEPEAELNRIKTEAELKRKFPKKMKRREDFLKYGYKGAPPENPPEGTAARGYIPNFSKQAVLDAIGREQKESGLPLSAIKVVQDARVRGPQNPEGYAVINNRDEPDGRVPNFAAPSGMDPEVFRALEDAIKRVIASSDPLKEGFEKIVKNMGSFGVTLEDVTKIAEEMNLPLSEASKAAKQNAESSNKNTEQHKDNTKQETDSSKNKVDTNRKEEKTVQDSLFTLLKYQTVIAGVTGALSTLGGGFDTFGRSLGSIGNTLITFKEGKNIVKEFLGTTKNEKGEEIQNTFSDILKNIKSEFVAGKGANTGVSGTVGGLQEVVSGSNLGTGLKAAAAKLGIYATVATEVYGAIDAVWTYFGDGAKEQEDAVVRLNEAMKDYNLTLSEQAKLISKRGIEKFSSEGNSSSFKGFLAQVGVSMGQAVNSTASEELQKKIDILLSSTANKKEGKTGSQIAEQIINSDKKLASKVTAETLASSGFTDTKDIILPLYQAISEIETSKNKLIPEGDKNKLTSSQVQENVDAEIERQIATLFGKTGVEFEKGVVELIKKATPKAQQASTRARELAPPSFGVGVDVVKTQLDNQYQIQKILRERTSLAQNLLTLEKELLTTSDSRRANLEYELKIIDLQKQRQGEIQDVVFEASKNKVNEELRNTPNIEEGRAKKIQDAFAKIGTVTNEDDLVKVYKEVQEAITGIGEEQGKLKTLVQEELNKQKENVKTIFEKYKTKKLEIDIETQRLAILAKINFIENNAKEFLNLQVSAQQRLIDQDKQRLDLQNQISDIMYETANLPTPNQDSYIKERSDLLRSLQTGGTRKEQELDFQRRSALQSDRSTALNIAFQKGATAEDVQSIVKADTYDALQEALQKVLNKQSSEINQKVTDAGNTFKIDIDAASNSINNKIIEAGINFFNKTDDAATNMGQKLGAALMATLTQPSAVTTTIAQVAQSNTSEAKANTTVSAIKNQELNLFSDSYEIFKALKQNQIPANSLLAPAKDNVDSSSLPPFIGPPLPPTQPTTSVAKPLESGPAAKALPAQAFLQASPSAVSNQDKEREKFARESEFKLKQLVFSAERRAIEKKLESENASISNAQKLIELRKQERDWQQRVRDSAFEVYKTQLSPYQAEKQTTFRGIETERVQAVQDNRDQIESAKLQAKQNQLQALQSRGATLKQINEFQSGKKEGGEILKELQSQVSTGDDFSNKVQSAADYFDSVVRKIADGWNEKFNKADKKQEKSVTPFGSESFKKDILSVKIEDEIKSDLEKPSFGLPIEENKKLSSFDSTKLSLGGPVIASEKNPSFESNIDTQKLREQYITAEKYNNPNLSKEDYQKTFEFISNTQQAVPPSREREINTIAANKSLAASRSFSQQENFGEGFKVALRDIDDELTKFDAVLGRQIPMNFRDGLVDAMKVLTDPNATTSLKERLLGVASAFLNKINEALMQNVANQFTKGITGLGGISGFASGGPIEGGSGTKDDVPAMLMGGEYVIKKSSVNKYGKDFFDELNSGKAKMPKQDETEYLNKAISKKVKKFADGGFVKADLNDLIKNPKKYTPYGQKKINGISFDENGRAIDLENYTGPEENKQDAIAKAQSNFYAKNQQSGKGGFFMPGSYGKGAIMGQKNLLAYATQETVGAQYDQISSSGGLASINLAAGSSNFSLFALRDQGNIKNAEYLESKNKALDLYFQGIQASKEKIKMDFDNQKEYEAAKKEYDKQRKQAKKAMLVNLGVTVGMAGLSAIGGAASAGKTAAQQAYASGQTGAQKPGFFTGMWGGAEINGETFGGVKNAFKFNSNAFKTANLLGTEGGALSWNSKDRSYQPLTQTEYNTIAPAGVSWSKGSVGTPYSWQSQRRAAGGFVAGNGMGDNVPTMLNGGEFVISKQAAQKAGYNNLQNLNSTGEVSEGSGEMTSRLEAKLEELVEKISGVGTINISVNSSGEGNKKESEDSSRQDQQNKELARKIKDVVLSVLRDEKRLGGMLR